GGLFVACGYWFLYGRESGPPPAFEATLAGAADEAAVTPLRPRAAAFSRRVSERFDVGLVLVCLSAVAYAAYFSVITILHHRNLGTRSFDLALEDNLMWNLVHGGPLFKSTPFSGPMGTHFGHHATFFAFVMAPLYALFPGAETLLVIQATLMGAAAVPLFLYARRRLPEWVAAQVASMYLLYPPLHGAALYDFHYLPLGVFFLWLALYAIDSKRRVLAVVAALLAISVREDVAFSLAVMGAFLLLAGEAAVAGSILAAVGGVYFLVMKLGVMPRFKGGAESFVNQYAGLLPPGGQGFGAILGTMVENPGFTANVVLDRDKYPYVLQIFTPLLFLPLRYPIAVLLVAPGVIFTLLSTGYSPLVQISFQYTTYWTAFVFIGLVVALARLSRPLGPWGHEAPLRLQATMTSLLVATLFCTAFNGAFLRHDTVRGGFDAFRFGTTTDDLRRRGELARLVGEIPPSASVAASEFLVPHVSTRQDAYTIRFGTYDAEYLLFDVPLNGDERAHVYPLLQSGAYGVVDDVGDLALAQRGHSTEGNAALLRR
ncbi:MAG TPA: DUF2079 domain-containing protein, partial [Polyangiaceae bacterium]